MLNTYAISEDSDDTAHMRSLVRAYAVGIHKKEDLINAQVKTRSLDPLDLITG